MKNKDVDIGKVYEIIQSNNKYSKKFDYLLTEYLKAIYQGNPELFLDYSIALEKALADYEMFEEGNR